MFLRSHLPLRAFCRWTPEPPAPTSNMLGRASRMSSRSGSSKDVAQKPTDTTDKLTKNQRLAAWRRYTLQAGLIMQYAAMQEKMKMLMPRYYRKALQASTVVKELGAAATPEEAKKKMQESPASTVINGQVVGAPLEPGKGKASVPAAQCEHPTSAMAPRGNSKAGGLKQSWWTCKLCQSRWIRFHYVRPTGEPHRDEVLTISKHKGKTYGQILEQYPNFAHWAVMTVENDPEATTQLKRFAAWVQKEQGAISRPSSPQPSPRGAGDMSDITGVESPRLSDLSDPDYTA